MGFSRVLAAFFLVASLNVWADSVPGAIVESLQAESFDLQVFNLSESEVALSIDGDKFVVEPDSAQIYPCNGKLHLLIELPGNIDYYPVACSSRLVFKGAL